MSNIEKRFDRLEHDCKRAKDSYCQGEIEKFHYFTGLIVGEIQLICELVAEEVCESAKSSKQ